MQIMLVGILLLTASGCAAIGDLFIPPHPKSLKASPEANCLTYIINNEELAVAALAPIAAQLVAGAIIDRAAKGLADEAGRYKASYSARASDHLLRTKKNNSILLNVSEFQFIRYQGADASRGCKSTAEPSLELNVHWTISESGDAIELSPTRFVLRSAKAKVPTVSWFPTSWWVFFDASRRKVDLNAQVTMTGITTTKKGRAVVELLKVDFPFGKVDLSDIGKTTKDSEGKEIPVHNTAWRDEADLAHLKSGWFPIPKTESVKCSTSAHTDRPHSDTHASTPTTEPVANNCGDIAFLPITLTVTVYESDDLGDIIAKGSKVVADNKSKMVEELLRNLDLKSQ